MRGGAQPRARAGAVRGPRWWPRSTSTSQSVSSGLPFWKRVKTIEFWEGEPAQDRQAVDQAPRGRGRDAAAQERARATLARRRARPRPGVGWFLDIVAAVTGRPRAEVHLGSRVSELGFDSLVYTELAEAVEARRHPGARAGRLHRRPGRGRAATPCARGARPARPAGPAADAARRERGPASLRDDDIQVPDAVARAGQDGASACPRSCSSGRCWTPRWRGGCTSPATPTSSWRPTTARTWTWAPSRSRWARRGAIWPRWRRPTTSSPTAGGGPTSATSPTWCRWSGSARSASRWTSPSGCCARGAAWWCSPRARARIDRGDGGVPAQPGLPGAARPGSGILPAHIAGTHEALPKGSAVPRSRELRVRFGPFLSLELLRALTEGCRSRRPGGSAAALHPADRREPARRQGGGRSTPPAVAGRLGRRPPGRHRPDRAAVRPRRRGKPPLSPHARRCSCTRAGSGS